MGFIVDIPEPGTPPTQRSLNVGEWRASLRCNTVQNVLVQFQRLDKKIYLVDEGLTNAGPDTDGFGLVGRELPSGSSRDIHLVTTDGTEAAVIHAAGFKENGRCIGTVTMTVS